MPIDPTIFLRGYKGSVDPLDQFQRAAQLRAQQRQSQLQDQQIQEGQIRLSEIGKQQQKQQAIEAAAKGAFKTPAPQTLQQPTVNVGGVNLQGGQSTVQGPSQFDQSAYAGNLQQAGLPMEAMVFQQQQQQQQAAQQKAQAELEKTKAETLNQLSQVPAHQIDTVLKGLDATGQIFTPVLNTPPGQEQPAWEQALNTAVQAGVMTPPAAQMHQQFPGREALTAQIGASKAGVEYLNQKRQAEQDALAQQNKERGFAQKDRELNLKASEIQGDAGVLTPEAKTKLATMFATTGQLPPLGMGKAGAKMRSDIMNQASKDYPNIDFASNAAAYKANKDSLVNITKTLDTLTAFENTSIKNLKQFTDLADKIPDTGIPWLNKPVRELDQNLVGSDNMSAVNAARTVALREIARVTNDPKLSGVLSDSARHEVMDLNPASANLKQIKSVAKILVQDMKNVHESLEAQRDAISGRIGVNPAAFQQSNQQTGGGIQVTDPNGGVHTFPDQASANNFKKLAGIK